LPWKECPYCGGLSYSASPLLDEWLCPYCSKDLTSLPSTDIPPKPKPETEER
jgi:hypothetical protein